MKKLIKSIKGSLDITSIVLDIALIVALVPVIGAFISGASNRCPSGYPLFNATNNLCYIGINATDGTIAQVGLSTVEITLLGLIALFIVIALVFMIVKQSGLSSKK